MKTPSINKKIIFIPGVQKAGTSTLLNMLKQHSKIIPPNVNEPQFFALQKNIVREYHDWYLNLFKDNEEAEWLIDKSTFYFSSERAHRNIKEYVITPPRFLVVIREPVKRAYSGYLHMKKMIYKYEKRTFEEIIATLKKRRDKSGKDLISIENKYLHESIKNGSVVPYINSSYLKNLYDAPFSSSFEDPLWPFKYFKESQYHQQIESLIAIFGKNRVKVIILENLLEKPERVIHEIFDFLKLKYECLKLPHSNKTDLPTGLGKPLLKILNTHELVKTTYLKLKSVKYISSLLEEIKEKVWKSKPNLSLKTYQKARDLLEEEYSYWSNQNGDTERLWTYH